MSLKVDTEPEVEDSPDDGLTITFAIDNDDVELPSTSTLVREEAPEPVSSDSEEDQPDGVTSPMQYVTPLRLWVPQR